MLFCGKPQVFASFFLKRPALFNNGCSPPATTGHKKMQPDSGCICFASAWKKWPQKHVNQRLMQEINEQAMPSRPLQKTTAALHEHRQPAPSFKDKVQKVSYEKHKQPRQQRKIIRRIKILRWHAKKGGKQIRKPRAWKSQYLPVAKAQVPIAQRPEQHHQDQRRHHCQQRPTTHTFKNWRCQPAKNHAGAQKRQHAKNDEHLRLQHQRHHRHRQPCQRHFHAALQRMF